MREMKISIHRHPNPQLRSFIVRAEISAYMSEHFKQPLCQDAMDTLNKLGAIGAQVVKDLMEIPGIEEIYIKPKEIRMKKKASFPWLEIESKTMEILNRALRRKKLKMVR